ncbi:unnamed protein product [Diamesa tonsa]
MLYFDCLVSDECNEKCPRPLIYEELGCTAIYGSNGCCPKRYHCTNFASLDKSRCHINGNSFAVGEILPRNLITDGAKCVESCFCSRYRNEPAKFSCANNECGISNIRIPGCTNVYGDLNECCSTSTICENEEKETLATCWMDGQTFTEGEKMYPAQNPCYECLCQNEFDNTTIVQNEHCQKINCGISLDKSYIQRGCLPIYESKSIACCPIGWKCPENEKKIVKRSVDDEEDEDDEVDEVESSSVSSNVFIVTPEATSSYLKSVIPEVESITSPSDVSNESTVPSTSAATTVIPADFLEPPSPTNASLKVEETTKQKSESDVLDLDDFIANVLKRTTEAPESTPSVESSSTVSSPIEESISVASAAQGKSIEESLIAIITSTVASSTTEEVTNTTTQSSTTSSTTQSSTTSTTTESNENYSETSEEGSTSESSEYSGELSKEESTSAATSPATTEATSPATSEATTVLASLATAEATTVSTTAEATSKAATESSTSEVSIAASLISSEPTIDTTIVPETNLESVTEITSEYKNFTISFIQGSTPSAVEGEVKGQPRKRSISEKTAIPYVLKALKQTGSTECVFSGTTYKAGEKIKTEDDCLKCFCEFPPIGQCFQKDNCYQ